jgi:hypothetical protein
MRQALAAVVVLAAAAVARADGALVVLGQTTDGAKVFAVATPNDGGFVKIGTDVYAVTLAAVLWETGNTYIAFDAPAGSPVRGGFLVVTPDGTLFGDLVDWSGKYFIPLAGTAVVR